MSEKRRTSGKSSSYGSTYDPGPSHTAKVRGSFNYAAHILGELEALNCELEEEIIRIGHRLDISQPPMVGKLGVRWWMHEGIRTPRLVEWALNAQGRLWPKKIGKERLIRRVKHRGAFALNHKETVECIELLLKALEMRESIAEGMKKIKQTIRGLSNTHKGVVKFQVKRGLEIDGQINENMRRAGYYQFDQGGPSKEDTTE